MRCEGGEGVLSLLRRLFQPARATAGLTVLLPRLHVTSIDKQQHAISSNARLVRVVCVEGVATNVITSLAPC